MDWNIKAFLATQETNYEDVVEEALINGLKRKYEINDEKELIHYLFVRCAVLNGIDSISDDHQFMNFVIRELCISSVNSDIGQVIKFNHGNNVIDVICGYAQQNSLANIFCSMERLFFSRTFVDRKGKEIGGHSYVVGLVSSIQKKAKQNLNPYKHSPYKNELHTLFKLKILNEEFCVATPTEAPIVSAFNQCDSRISVETLYERYLHAENFDTTNVHSIAEASVRDYLYVHLNLIEDGLRPIMKEYQTKEGRVDIVAKDKDGNWVVIELKTENDKRLIWQCMYYPDEVKVGLGKYDDDKRIRMITVAPEYPEHIRKPLEKLGYVENYVYTIKAFNGVIEEMGVEVCGKTEKEDESDAEIGDDVKAKLDGLIGAFVYTRGQLVEKCGEALKEKELNDVAVKLVEIAFGAERVIGEN